MAKAMQIWIIEMATYELLNITLLERASLGALGVSRNGSGSTW